MPDCPKAQYIYITTLLQMITTNLNIEFYNSKILVGLCRIGYIDQFIFGTCVSTKGRLREDSKRPSARTLLLSAERILHALIMGVLQS